MKFVRALHQICRNPTRRMISTNTFDEDGNLILRSDSDIHQPGKIFAIDDSLELLELLEAGAVEEVLEVPAEETL